MKPSARITMPTVSRGVHQIGTHGLSLAALVALTAGMGCSSEQDERPLLPCGVEERDTSGELRALLYRGYDERGNHVLSERYGLDGTVADRFVWQYAPGGGLSLATVAFSSGRERELALQYGADDKLLSATWTALDGTQGRADYEHLDDAGLVIERWDSGGDGTVEETVTYTYGPDGNLQGSSTIFCDDVVDPADAHTTMLRDEEGRIERVENWSDGELSALSEYSYNEDGLLESMQRWFGDMLVIEESYEFDSRGNVRGHRSAIVQFTGEFPPPWSESYAVYDPAGRILSLESFFEGEPGGKSIYLYECPDFEDTPGRRVGTPDLAAPPEVMGPRGKAGPEAVLYYYASARSCPSSSAAPR